MIGRVKRSAAGLDLGGIGWGVPNVMPVKIRQRNQSGGVLTGIKTLPRRIAVSVNDISVKSRAHRARALQQAIIERMDVPIRIIQPPTAGVQPRGNIIGDISAGMGQAQNNWAVALTHLDRGHGASSGMVIAAAVTRSPSRTMIAAASRSGAI